MDKLRNFRLTVAARVKLTSLESVDAGNRYIPTIFWAHGAALRVSRQLTYEGEKLSIGQYRKEKLTLLNSKIVSIQGVELIIEPWWFERLEGKTLDFRDGSFELLELNRPGFLGGSNV